MRTQFVINKLNETIENFSQGNYSAQEVSKHISIVVSDDKSTVTLKFNTEKIQWQHARWYALNFLIKLRLSSLYNINCCDETNSLTITKAIKESK